MEAIKKYPLFGDIIIDAAVLCGVISLALYLKYRERPPKMVGWSLKRAWWQLVAPSLMKENRDWEEMYESASRERDEIEDRIEELIEEFESSDWGAEAPQKYNRKHFKICDEGEGYLHHRTVAAVLSHAIDL